jgi:hypothetical protein
LQTKEAIQFLHELGTVQYFDNDFLRNIIVINPQWIVNVMSCVVSVKNSPIQVCSNKICFTVFIMVAGLLNKCLPDCQCKKISSWRD